MGVYSGRVVGVVAEAMIRLGVKRAFVVHGDGGLDELSLSGASVVAEVRAEAPDDGPIVRRYSLTPDEAGLMRAPSAALAGGADVAANTRMLQCILGLDGERAEEGPQRDVVLLNAAAVLVAAGLTKQLRMGVARAREALVSGAVQGLMDALRRR